MQKQFNILVCQKLGSMVQFLMMSFVFLATIPKFYWIGRMGGVVVVLLLCLALSGKRSVYSP